MKIEFILIFISLAYSSNAQVGNSTVEQLKPIIFETNTCSLLEELKGQQEIFKMIRQFPVINNLSQLEFELALKSKLVSYISKDDLQLQITLIFTNQKSTCVSKITASEELNSDELNKLVQFLSNGIEFQPAIAVKRNVHCFGYTKINISQGNVSSIEHENYIFK